MLCIARGRVSGRNLCNVVLDGLLARLGRSRIPILRLPPLPRIGDLAQVGSSSGVRGEHRRVLVPLGVAEVVVVGPRWAIHDARCKVGNSRMDREGTKEPPWQTRLSLTWPQPPKPTMPRRYAQLLKTNG